MLFFTTATSYLAISQLLLTALFYFIYYRQTSLGVITSLLCISLIAACLGVIVDFDIEFLNYIRGRIAAASPALVWLFAHALFVDDRQISPVTWFFIISYQIARAIVVFFEQMNGLTDNVFLDLLSLYGLLIAFGLALHVVILATIESGNDLLEERRRLRGPFAAGLGVVMTLLVGSLLSPGLLSDEVAATFALTAVNLSYSLIFLFFLGINLLSINLSPESQLLSDGGVVEPHTKASAQLQLSEADFEAMRQIDEKMLNEKLFENAELTIGQLAQNLSVQEYKLRIFINRELGYRNFNQFLNFYRINEACKLLEQKSKHRNISIIAQNVGYKSLSTFNQAFKKLRGITPSEYKTRSSN